MSCAGALHMSGHIDGMGVTGVLFRSASRWRLARQEAGREVFRFTTREA